MQNRSRFFARICAASLAVAIGAVFFAGCGDDGNGDSRIFFNANGASGAVPNPIIASAGTTATLPGPGDLVKAGYAFLGWNTNAAGTGTNHNEGASIPVPSGNITLFANWEYAAISITVTGIPARYFGFEGGIEFVEYRYDDIDSWFVTIALSFPAQIDGSSATFSILCAETFLPFTESGTRDINLLFLEDESVWEPIIYMTIGNIGTGANTIPFSNFFPY